MLFLNYSRARNIRNPNIKFQHTTRSLKDLPFDVLLKEKASMFTQIPNNHFDAFKMRSSIVFMMLTFCDVMLSRNVAPKTEYSYALLLSKYKVFQTTNQNVGN